MLESQFFTRCKPPSYRAQDGYTDFHYVARQRHLHISTERVPHPQLNFWQRKRCSGQNLIPTIYCVEEVLNPNCQNHHNIPKTIATWASRQYPKTRYSF